MWSIVHEVKILKIEGLDNSDLCAQFYLNNSLFQDLSPFSSDNSFKIPSNSSVRLIVKCLNPIQNLSISFNTSLIQHDGPQWFPLFKEIGQDCISCIPTELNDPKVWISFNKKFGIQSESEEEQEEDEEEVISEDFMPKISLFDGSNEIITEGVKDENFELKEIEKLTMVNEKLRAQSELRQKMWEVEKETREVLESDAKRAKDALIDELMSVKQREKELIEECAKLSALNIAANTMIMSLELQLKSAHCENQRLQTQISAEASSTFLKLSDLSEKLKIYECSQSSTLNKLNDFLCTTPLASKLQEKELVIEKLTKDLQDLQTKSSKPTMAINEIDDAVLQLTCKLNLTQMHKDPEQNYIMNDKRFTLLLKDGELYCRTGKNLQPFEEHLKTSSLRTQSLKRLSPNLSKISTIANSPSSFGKPRRK